MTPTTLVLAYYDNPTMLQEQYNRIKTLHPELRDLLGVVVVDDCSPKTPAFPDDLGGVSLQIYRMKKDIRWNQDACRNIGVAHAEHNWVLMTDMDHVVPEETWRVVLKKTWDPDTVYQFNRVSAPDMSPYKPHPNTWFMTRKKFDEVGGYDERFAGLYGTDGEFRSRVVQFAEIKQMKANVIRYPRTVIADASTTTYLRKQPEDRAGLARVHAQRKAEGAWTPYRGTFEYERVYP